ncbi:MAG: type II toxin-antitoxin system prevent-host-death family antitoxin [Acidobacteriota bacterium]|nr:type II toxin-antitoxin system prevent-host-death family antitoxin [Acidobacteriota bacterium]MDP3719399.1 type II toxin-antitoxin system prevent-host-death family antitoxin [Acidobacteriota bacterium]
MKRTTSVVQLKARLSEYLRIVKAGHELVITERGVPVARVVPLDEAERKSTRRARLARAGLLKAGRGKLPKWFLQAPAGEPSGVLEALLEERREAGDR